MVNNPRILSEELELHNIWFSKKLAGCRLLIWPTIQMTLMTCFNKFTIGNANGTEDSGSVQNR